MLYLLIFISLLPFVMGHARWKCPSARDYNSPSGAHISFDNTGNKNGPCGPFSGIKYWGMGGVFNLTPGLMTVVWEESISHNGSPFRLAILDEKEQVVTVLLDHIPHWDDSNPSMMRESSYVPYKMTVNIPDINCTQCSLQLLYIMTDKTTLCNIGNCTYYAEDSACSGHTDSTRSCFGAPNDNMCLKPNTCFSNYHSCTDIRIDGKLPFESFDGKLPFESFDGKLAFESFDGKLPIGKLAFESFHGRLRINRIQSEIWPYSNLTANVYQKESSTWKDGWLLNVPKDFTTPVGMCT